MADDKGTVNASSGSYSKGYGKRPLWQWILLYVVVGGVIYWAVYYFYLKPKADTSSAGLYGSSSSTSSGLYSY